MELFPWEKKYVLGIQDIDDQHKKLISLINKLHDAMMAGKGRSIIGDILSELLDYTDYHFTTEEEKMSRQRYRGVDEHRRQHNFFKAQINEFLKDYLEGDYMITMEVSDFLKEWLSSHILGSDIEFAAYLRSKGET
jgi:hemerythrin